MKPNQPLWQSHGTTTDIKKPGTFWTYQNAVIFTPAPYNCRRIAKEEHSRLISNQLPKYKSHLE
jgi:hypothetical protein